MIQLVMSFLILRIDYCNYVLVELQFLVSNGPECSRSAHSRPQSTISRHSCPTTTPLASSSIPNSILSSNDHAQHFPSTFCAVSQRPHVTFCTKDSQRRHLRSSATRSAVVCPSRTQFGRRASQSVVQMSGAVYSFVETGQFKCRIPESTRLLWSPYGIGQTIIFSCCGLFFFFFFFLFFPRLISAAADWMSAILPHMVWP